MARIAPERRTRLDLIITAILVVAAVAAGLTLWITSPARKADLQTAATEPKLAPVAGDAPTRLRELWRAPSNATAVPAVARATVISADGGDIVAHDPAGGAPVWRYHRDNSLCRAVAAWPGGDDDVLAVYRDSRGCSEVTSFDAGTGLRRGERTSDADDTLDLSYDDTFALAAGPSRLETWGTNLVRGIEYGRVDAPVNPGVQPDRSACHLYSAVSGSSRVAVIERCADDDGYRLTVLGSTLTDDEKVKQYGSQVITDSAGDPPPQVIATTDQTVTVYDGGGTGRGAPSIRQFSTDIEEKGREPVPGDLTPPAESRPLHGQGLVTYWTGKATTVLDASTGKQRFSVPDTIGPGELSTGLLVPVKNAISVRDPNNGREIRKIPVDRGSYTGLVSLRVLGPYVIEQRGSEIVALG
ncbi:MAG: PQQ-binding-like beta-propeller repeat protein [Gordonia sp. (in: high G+C Gram-positive bacteria)]|uniref:Rv3212 family protein n=1 Tax=Gordonia sp. (in: high G+C Gram-positive bacteria) TaxID=84139 RepID=UPI0039E27E61